MATDAERMRQLFGRDDLVPLWVAEPYVDLAPAVVEAIQSRASVPWYGYETRPRVAVESFWEWTERRHGWTEGALSTSISPSVGTSIGALIDLVTDHGDGVILQPPVFTDFKPLVTAAGRTVVKNSLLHTDAGYRIDFDLLKAQAADPSVSLLILCNPHNPVGRAWTTAELGAVASICATSDVFVISDEIHADLVLGGARFTPFGQAAADTGVRWAATHGPIKTFGLAGISDSLLISHDSDLTAAFRSMSSRLHLTRNNVFGVAAMSAAYHHGDAWLDQFLGSISDNLAIVRMGLPDGIELVEPDATFLAWLDFRSLGLQAPDLVRWLADAGVAFSPGHWFGREGAGYARMTVAAPTETVERAVELLRVAGAT